MPDGEAKTDCGFASNSFPIVEPGTMLMVVCGLLGLAAVGRKRFLKRV
jgi:hypothetical protein